MSDPPPKKLPHGRLDAALVERGLAESRAKAQGLILAGRAAFAFVLGTVLLVVGQWVFRRLSGRFAQEL